MLYNKDWEIKIEVNPTAKLLRDAADLIEKRGHAKEVLEDVRGGLCFMGALQKVTGSFCYYEDHADAVDAVANHLKLGRWRANACDSVVEWNNAPERTGQEVIDAMRGAADALCLRPR